MKNHRTVLLLLLATALVASSCRSRTDRSEGTVLLSVANFTGLPTGVSLGSTTSYQVGSITLQNIPKDPTGTTSDLQGIELKSYTVTYRRRDTGTRVPPPLTNGIFGLVAVNSTFNLTNVPYLTNNQILSPPLSDLINFGHDTETGTAVIVLDVTYQFFGTTLSGDDIASSPSTFTIEVTP
jgi:hypothetical protein